MTQASPTTHERRRPAPILSSDLLERPARIVALSGGKDSTAMALRLAEVEPEDYKYCITPTGRELPEMVEHWNKLECLLGRPLIRVPGPSLLDKIKQYKTLPNFRLRYCTREVKIEPFITYAASAKPAICYVGIRADEVEDRTGTNWNGIEGVTQNLPLVRWGWGVNKVRDPTGDAHYRDVKRALEAAYQLGAKSCQRSGYGLSGNEPHPMMGVRSPNAPAH